MASKWNGKPEDFPHGTTTGYRKYGCREDDCGCREANTQDLMEWRRRKGVKPTTNRKQAIHGTRAMHKTCTAGEDGGKCEPCRKANRDYQRVYMRMWRSGVPFTDPMIEAALRDV